MCSARALWPVPSGFSGRLAPAGRWGRPSTPIAGATGGYLPSEKPLAAAFTAPHSTPPYPPGPLLSGTHDASRNASGLNLALENYTGEPTAPGDKPS